jgi:hypothetical protein
MYTLSLVIYFFFLGYLVNHMIKGTKSLTILTNSLLVSVVIYYIILSLRMFHDFINHILCALNVHNFVTSIE